jgi:2-polyprenyl-6-methoxyphenol hydroxylase-like FAD-dependent oxidoreductase
MQNRDILISGAGIAGPALAFWLRRHGFNPTVVERAAGVREGGYAVDFRGESMRDLARMGLLDEVQRAQTHMGAVWHVDAANRRRASMPAELLSGEVEILRGDLAGILYEATRGETEYRFGDSIATLKEDDTGVRAHFAGGASRRFDLVIGADGPHSGVRALTFGPEAQFTKHLGCYVAIFTTDNFLDLDHTGHYYSEPGRVAALYSARENTEAKASFYFTAPPLDYDYRDGAAGRRIVAEHYAGAGWIIPRLLRAMWDAPDFYFDAVSQIQMERWSRGRVALLGDAAYCASPLSGMGSGLAIIGAYILAGELAAADGDHGVAFARYEALMRPYVAACQKLGQDGAAHFIPQSRAASWATTQIFRLLPYLPFKGMITGGALKAANAITLPIYAA